MLESLVRFSIRQRIVVFLGVLGLLASGVYSYINLPIEAFPDVLNQTVQVITLATGRSATDIERQITLPLEREFSGIPKVDQMRSISEFGLSVIYLYFQDGVDRYWSRAQTLEKLSTATLPNGITPYLAPLASVTGEVLRYELKSDTLNGTELRTLQDWVLEKQFRSIPGVADVVGFGGKVKTWDVAVDPYKLATFNIPLKQVEDVIQNSNQNAGGNLIDWPNQSFVVRALGQFTSKEDLANVGIVQRGSAVIRLSDIAVVKDSFSPIRGVVGRDDRDDIVQGIVLLRKGENPVVVGRLLREKVADLNSGTLLPAGVHIVPYSDRMKLVEKTTNTVARNLFEGFLLVCLILYLFLRNKYATGLVSVIVPLSLCFSFTLILLTGTPANLISLGAIDFGIIVDGAVIIVEFILAEYFTRQHAGEPFSIEKSVLNVVKPVSVSMVIIIVAYLPIFALQSVEGKTYSPLAYTISFNLIGALLLSLTLVPALLGKVISHAKKHPHVEPKWFLWLQARYLNLLRSAFRCPKRILVSSFGIIGVGIFLFLISGTEFLPELDEGALWIRAAFPHSTSLEEGKKLARKVRSTLKGFDEVRTVVSQLGGPEDGTDPNLFDNCEFYVDLKPKEQWHRFGREREKFVHAVREALEGYPGISFNVSQPIADNVEEAISGVKGKNAAKIYGPDLEVLYRIAGELSDNVSKVAGTTDVSLIAAMPSVPHLTVQIDRVKVAQMGLTLLDVEDVVEAAVGGKNITEVYEGESRVSVVLRAPNRYRNSLESIRELPISVTNGPRVRLEQVASVEMRPAPQAIYRENGFRRIGVKFNVEGRDLKSVMDEILAKTKSVEIPAGYFVKWGGEYENQQRAMRRLAIVIPATLLLIGIILFMLFENLWVVGWVLLTLFVSVVGSIGLLAARGIPFSVSAAVGLLALFGVVALNDVTLASRFMECAKASLNREEDLDVLEICRDRFRPILMTSLMAAVGLLPAAVSHGMGSETQRPLATAVIGGLVTALPSVLFLLPVGLYLIRKQVKATLRAAR